MSECEYINYYYYYYCKHTNNGAKAYKYKDETTCQLLHGFVSQKRLHGSSSKRLEQGHLISSMSATY